LHWTLAPDISSGDPVVNPARTLAGEGPNLSHR